MLISVHCRSRTRTGEIVLVKTRSLMVKTAHGCLQILAPALLICLCSTVLHAQGAGGRIPIKLEPEDVLPTGNQWISLPDIRTVDGALTTFNVISMRSRGLLQVNGQNGGPALEPYFMD